MVGIAFRNAGFAPEKTVFIPTKLVGRVAPHASYLASEDLPAPSASMPCFFPNHFRPQSSKIA